MGVQTYACLLYTSEDLARNDGLTPSEFAAWFIPLFDKAQENALTFAIIQFTTFRY